MSSVKSPLLSPIGAYHCLHDVVSFAHSVGHLYAVFVKRKKVSRYTPSNLGLQTSGSSESAILIFGRVLTCAGSGVNKVTDASGADIKSEFFPSEPGHLRQICVDIML